MMEFWVGFLDPKQKEIREIPRRQATFAFAHLAFDGKGNPRFKNVEDVELMTVPGLAIKAKGIAYLFAAPAQDAPAFYWSKVNITLTGNGTGDGLITDGITFEPGELTVEMIGLSESALSVYATEHEVAKLTEQMENIPPQPLKTPQSLKNSTLFVSDQKIPINPQYNVPFSYGSGSSQWVNEHAKAVTADLEAIANTPHQFKDSSVYVKLSDEVAKLKATKVGAQVEAIMAESQHAIEAAIHIDHAHLSYDQKKELKAKKIAALYSGLPAPPPPVKITEVLPMPDCDGCGLPLPDCDCDLWSEPDGHS